jgi:hypothetical protein
LLSQKITGSDSGKRRAHEYTPGNPNPQALCRTRCRVFFAQQKITGSGAGKERAHEDD